MNRWSKHPQKSATRFPWCPLRLLRGFFATDKHRAQSCPGALQWDGTGNICGLKERGRGWRGSGQRTQTGGAQTLHCARPWQMGTAKHAACFLVNRFMKEHRKDNRALWPFNFSCQMTYLNSYFHIKRLQE